MKMTSIEVDSKHFILKLQPLESHAPRWMCVAPHYYIVCMSFGCCSMYVLL